MARQPRFVLPGHPQHVIQRGVDRAAIFFDHGDYRHFLDWLSEACTRHECAVHAYVLMTNHVHLLMTPGRENSIGKVMQSVGRRYVQFVNCSYRRTGTLWEGRYRATLIDSEAYLLACMTYIELNPVRARMVERPEQYRWSSHRANAHGAADPLMVEHPIYQSLGRDAAERLQAYRDLFRAELDPQTVNNIRAATQKGWALGNERFLAQVEGMVNRRARAAPRGGDRRSSASRERIAGD